jgi:hypothetical protein
MHESPSPLVAASLLFFVAFSAVAVVDAAWFHLRRFRP